jgi:UvrD-like helicase C-terminal domain
MASSWPNLTAEPSPFGELDMLVPAYAATIHKSQGSEPAVVIPIMTQHYGMLQRNRLYTAVTRDQGLARERRQGRVASGHATWAQ